MTLEASIVDAQRMIKQSAEDNPSSLSDFIARLDPTTKATLRNTLIGMLLGGGAGVGAGAMNPGTSMLGSGITGSLMGGFAGGAGTLGYDMLTSRARMPGETGRPPGDMIDRYAVDPAVGFMAAHPGTTAGGVVGTLWGVNRMPTWGASLQAAREADEVTGFKARPPGPGNPKGTPYGPAAQELIDADKLPTLKARLMEMFNELRTKGIGAARAAGPTKGNTALLGMHDVLTRRGLYGGKGVRSPWNLAAIPAGIGAGYMIDRYIKGQNR